MTPGKQHLAIAMISWLLAFMCATASFADRRVVVLDIEGARSTRLRDSIAELIEEKVALVSVSEYAKKAKQLKAKTFSPAHVKKVAKALRLDAIVEGTLTAVDDHYKLIVRLRSGKDGSLRKKIAMTLSAPRLSSKLAKGLRSRLLATLGDLPSKKPPVKEGFEDEETLSEDDAEEAPRVSRTNKTESKPEPKVEAKPQSKRPQPSDEDEPDTERTTEQDTERDTKRATKRAKDAARDSDSDDDETEITMDGDVITKQEKEQERPGSDASNDLISPKPELTPENAGLIVMVGSSLQRRNLSFAYEGLPKGNPPDYIGEKAFPGYVLQAEIFPMALMGKTNFSRNLGVGLSFEQPFQLSSRITDAMTKMTAEYQTSYRKISADVRVRLSWSKFQFVGFVGYHKLGFAINESAQASNIPVNIPDVEYTYWDVGGGFRMGLGGRLRFMADARGMLVRNAGEIQSKSQYGKAIVTGIDVMGGLEFQVVSNFMFRAGVNWQRIGFNFQDLTIRTDPNDDKAMDVVGASDTYLGGFLSLGYLL